MPTCLINPIASADFSTGTAISTSGATVANLWQDVDDYSGGGPGGTADGVYVYNTDFTTGVTFLRFTLEDVPLDFGELISAVVYYNAVDVNTPTGPSDRLYVNAALYDGLGAYLFDALDARLLSHSGLTGAVAGDFGDKSITPSMRVRTTTRADMIAGTGAYVDIKWDYSRSMGSDNIQMGISAVQLELTYSSADVTESPTLGSMTISGKVPSAFETVVVHKPPTGRLLMGSAPAPVFPTRSYGHPYTQGTTDSAFGIAGAFYGVANATVPWTVEAWVRVEQPTSAIVSYDQIFSLYGPNGHLIMVSPIAVNWYSWGNVFVYPIVEAYTWVKHVLTWDGTTARYFRDGTLCSSQDITGKDASGMFIQFSGYSSDGIYWFNEDIPVRVGDIRVTVGVDRYGDVTTIPVPTDHYPEGDDDPLWAYVTTLINFRTGKPVNYGFATVTVQEGGSYIMEPPYFPTAKIGAQFELSWNNLPPAGELKVIGEDPLVVTGVLSAPTGNISTVGHSPNLPWRITPVGSLSFTGHEPNLIFGQLIQPDAGSMTLTGVVPVIDDGLRTVYTYPHTTRFYASGSYTARLLAPFVMQDYSGQFAGTNGVRLWYSYWWQLDVEGAHQMYPARPTHGDNEDYGFTSYDTVGGATDDDFWYDNIDSPTPQCKLTDAQGTSMYGFELGPGEANYASDGWTNGYPWLVARYAHHHSTSSASWVNYIGQWTDDATVMDMTLVGAVPWYGTDAYWVGNFYGKDCRSGTEEGYLLGKIVQGSDTVPALYKWSGGTTWDAGTALLDGAEEAVNYDCDIVGWCRAVEADPDKIYVLVTTKNASTSAFLHFKILGVVLSTMTITKIVDDNTDHGDNGEWYIGKGHGGNGTYARFFGYPSFSGPPGAIDGNELGSTSAEERCRPIDYDGEEFFWFRTQGTSATKQYTRLILNSSNWLAPTYDVRDANLSDVYPAEYDYGVVDEVMTLPRWSGLHVCWDSENGSGVSAVETFTRGRGMFAYRKIETWIRDRDLMDPTASFNAWRCVNRGLWPASSGDSTTPGITYMMDASRGWNTYGGKNTPLVSSFGFLDDDAANDGVTWKIEIQWWRRGEERWIDETVYTAISPHVTISQEGQVVGTVDNDLGLGVSFGDIEVRGSLYFTGHYELEEAASLLDISVAADLNLACDISDDSSVTVIVNTPLGLSIDLTEDVLTNFRQKQLTGGSEMWAQTWVDELVTLVNVDRAAQSLPLIRAIDYIDQQRITANQSGGRDPVQQVAEDMRRRDSDLPFQVGDEFPTGTSFTDAVTPAAVQYFTQKPPVTGGEFPTAADMWGAVGGWSSLTAFFLYDSWATAGTEVYLQVGRAWRDSPNTTSGIEPQEDTSYFFVTLLDYTGEDYNTGTGGFRPTVHPVLTRTMTGTTSNHGITWNEEFTTILNSARLDAGLRLLSLPDKAFYTKYPIPVGHIHGDNLHEAQLITHSSDVLPEGWETPTSRGDIAGYTEGGAENIITALPSAYHDEDNPSEYTEFSIMTNYTFPTPLQAFTSWWNSPGHKAAMMYDWPEEADPYCVMDFNIKQLLVETTYQDLVHAGQPFVDLRAGQWVFLINVFANVATEMATKYLDGGYQFEGALIEILDGTYDLTAYTPVTVAHQLSYSLKIGSTMVGPYSARVEAQHTAILQYGVGAAHTAPYGPTVPAQLQHEAVYAIKDTITVGQDHSAPYSWHVATQLEGVYDATPIVRVGHQSPYDSFSTVGAEHEGLYDSSPTVSVYHSGEYTTPYGVSASHTGVFALRTLLQASHTAPYVNTVPIQEDHEGDYTLSTTDPVAAQHSSYYSVLGSAVATEAPVALLTKGPLQLLLDDLTLAQSEQDPAWVARVSVSRQEDFVSLTRGDTVTISLGAESWTLVITEKSVSRQGPADTRMILKAESPIVNLMSPRAPDSDFVFNTADTARNIVETILGQTVDWQLYNWTVGAGRVAITSSTPYNAAKVIMDAVGGVIQSKRDGTLLLRYKYPTPMNKLASAAPAHTLTDIEDNLTADEGFEYRSGVNKIRIVEGDSTFNDRINWVPDEDDPTRGVLEVYLSPWRSTYSLKQTDSDGATSIRFAGTVTREEQKLVEFTEGRGTVDLPVKTLVSVDWASDSLGAVTVVPYSTTLNTGTDAHQGYGLADVVYEVQLDTYNVTGVLGDTTQFIIEDEG